MSLRSTFTRLGITLAAGALLAAAGATPALADDDWDPDRGGDSRDWDNGDGGSTRDWDHGDEHRENPRDYRGRVTARGGLTLRSAPNRGSQVIRVAPYGEIVSIFCKSPGQRVENNPIWYLLTDGTWAWGAARYIDNIGPSPRWC
jgi:hypothetical protein